MLDLLFLSLALLVSLPALSLLVLTTAALRKSGAPEAGAACAQSPPRIAVLVPAHNESAHVLPTIASIRRQLGPADRLVLVADNCTDDTASLARAAGAEVVERHDAARRGKGYALAFGVDHLRASPPDVVLVVDADCTLSADAVGRIARRCHDSGRPVQMLNLMSAPPQAELRLRILEFAMLMKNLVRPLGSYRLGRACHLMGTGMALPWPLMAGARLATGHIAEDMLLGIELAVAGHAPQFLPEARVSSAFPLDTGVARVQKSRWEHGHLAILMEALPGLAAAALRTGRPALLALTLDLLIPPLALYVLLLAAANALGLAAAWLLGAWHPAITLLLLAMLAMAAAIGMGWFFFGRHLLSARELLRTPLYALWKIPVYVAFFLRRKSGWVRTRREKE